MSFSSIARKISTGKRVNPLPLPREAVAQTKIEALSADLRAS
jgi:hypothetical protein